jgi:hypothetical protein
MKAQSVGGGWSGVATGYPLVLYNEAKHYILALVGKANNKNKSFVTALNTSRVKDFQKRQTLLSSLYLHLNDFAHEDDFISQLNVVGRSEHIACLGEKFVSLWLLFLD